MANLSQGAPGNVDNTDAPVTLIHEHSSTIDGKSTVVLTYSDGSRKVYVNNVLENDVAIKSDEEKIAEPINSSQVSDLNESQKNEIRSLHPGVADSTLFTAVVPVASAPVANSETVSTPTEEDLAAIAEKAAEAAAALVAAADAEAAKLEEQAREAEKAAAEEVAKLAAEAEAALEAAKEFVAENEPKVEGFVANVEEKVEDAIDAVQDKLHEIEFKSVAELKELASKLGIDLGKATKKDDIIAVVKESQATSE